MSVFISAKNSNSVPKYEYSDNECVLVFKYLDRGSKSNCLRCNKRYDIVLADTFCKPNEDNYQFDVLIDHFHIYTKNGLCGSQLHFPWMPNPEKPFEEINYGYDENRQLILERITCNMRMEDDIIIPRKCGKSEFERPKEIDEVSNENKIYCKPEITLVNIQKETIDST